MLHCVHYTQALPLGYEPPGGRPRSARRALYAINDIKTGIKAAQTTFTGSSLMYFRGSAGGFTRGGHGGAAPRGPSVIKDIKTAQSQSQSHGSVRGSQGGSARGGHGGGSARGRYGHPFGQSVAYNSRRPSAAGSARGPTSARRAKSSGRPASAPTAGAGGAYNDWLLGAWRGGERRRDVVSC